MAQDLLVHGLGFDVEFIFVGVSVEVVQAVKDLIGRQICQELYMSLRREPRHGFAEVGLQNQLFKAE